MTTMKKITTLSLALLFFSALGMNASFAGKPTGGGGGGKIKVLTANPGNAQQGATPTVKITGENFVNVSDVRFFVGGTNDSSQISTGNIQVISSTELQVDIEVASGALTVDYDIEVQAVSGRKGKGTTLFKVNKIEEECVDTSFPTMAYVRSTFSGRGKKATESRDIYLNGDNGCTETLLIGGLSQEGFSGGIRLSVRGTNGYVTWVDNVSSDTDVHNLFGLSFSVSSNLSITPGSAGAELIYTTDVGGYIAGHDTIVDEVGNVQVVMQELLTFEDRILSLLDVSTGMIEDIVYGSCQVQDSVGECFNVSYRDPVWSPDGVEVYFTVRNRPTTNDITGIARIAKTESGWSSTELIMVGTINDAVTRPSISLSGVMAYQYDDGFQQNGLRDVRVGIVDPDQCAASVCNKFDGQLGVVRRGGAPVWTVVGSLLTSFIGDDTIVEYIEPIDAILGELDIPNAAYVDSDL